jgi:hypothetical protein
MVNVRRGAPIWLTDSEKEDLIDKHGDNIIQISQHHRLDHARFKIDFMVNLKDGTVLFVECKFGNSTHGRGLSRIDSTNDLFKAFYLVKHHAKLEKLKKYKKIVYTNGLPSETSDNMHALNLLKNDSLIDEIVVLNTENSTVEGFFHG